MRVSHTTRHIRTARSLRATAGAGVLLAGVVLAAVLAPAAGADPVDPVVPTPNLLGDPTPVTASMVALGDSWAAGSAAGGLPLVGPADPTTTATTDADCRRTTASYPAAVGPTVAPGTWTSRACAATAGGANTQFDVLSPAVRTVTVTVGADATGLGGVARDCATGQVPAPKDPVATAAACDAATGRFDRALGALPSALDTAMADIRTRAPNARVLMTNYPLLTEGAACLAGAADPTTARRIDDAVVRLDGVLAERAQVAGLQVVDVRPAFTGHGVCSPQPWITPFAGTDVLTTGAATSEGQSALTRAVTTALTPPVVPTTTTTTPRPTTTTTTTAPRPTTTTPRPTTTTTTPVPTRTVIVPAAPPVPVTRTTIQPAPSLSTTTTAPVAPSSPGLLGDLLDGFPLRRDAGPLLAPLFGS